jgi:DNA-binding SARP family transcriptional activator
MGCKAADAVRRAGKAKKTVWKQIIEEGASAGSGWEPWNAGRQVVRTHGGRHAVDDGGLVARGRELANIDRNLQQARLGRASAIELRGESGVGKSSLIEIAITRAPQFRTVMIRGDKETGLPAARPEWPQPLKDLVHQLELVHRAHQGDPQTPPAPAIEAVTNGLRQIAEQTQIPTLVTLDDAQFLPAWLVTAIAEAVCTRLQDRSISLIVARNDAPNVAAVPALSWPTTHTLAGLNAAQTATLLGSHLAETPNEQVIAQLVGGTSGNPMALLDICSRLSAEQLAGWQPLPDPLPVGPTVIESFDLASHMPDKTRAWLAVRAITRAPSDRLSGLLASLGLEDADLVPAVDAGIVVANGTRMDFCHPLVRASVFHGASPEHKRLARQALSVELERQNTFESRAYFAVADTNSPDEMVASRFAESAHTALEEGDPGAAAHNEEQAARFAASDDAVVSHLAAAAALWRSAGVLDRARYCIEAASELTAGDAVAGQLAYQRAWLIQEQGEGAVAEQILKAAELCAGDAPHRAVTMLVDAAAWKLLANSQAEAERIADRAVQLAATVSSHAENLAAAVRIAVTPGAGITDDPSTRSRFSLLMGQTDHFPASPEVAMVVGHSLQRQGLVAQAERWIQWVERCAERDGDVQLRIAARVMRALSELSQLNVADAAESVDAVIAELDLVDSAAVAAWVWALAVQVRATSGEHERGFSDSVHLFALPPAIGAIPRLLATASLASLDFQRGRVGATRAWLATAVEELLRGAPQNPGEFSKPPAMVIGLAPLSSTMALLADHSFDRTLEPLLSPSSQHPWQTLVSAVCEHDAAKALTRLESVRKRFTKVPAALAHIDLCYATKLVQAGRQDEGRELLEQIRDAATETGAGGIATLASEQLHQLERRETTGTALGESSYTQLPAAPGAVAASPVITSAPAAAWEINLLGDFTVLAHGKSVHLPPSLATEAIKIVALQGQIIVDQLVELLWEDASPGVGVRRLRNVLWRIRTACGDVVVRDGQFLRLANEAVTDLGRFEELANQALTRDASPQAAAQAAREALHLYRGELLPANRYDDWTTRAREVVSRSKVSLLELLIDDALDNEQSGEALTLLDRLAQEDPNDEAPLVRMAELHLLSGNRSRALESLDRAESILADLGIGTTPAIGRLRETLSRR